MSDCPCEEEFRAIEGFPGYEVSNLGRVRSWKMPGSQFQRDRIGPGSRILKRCNGPGGYLTVNLHHNGQQRSRYVHDLVAKAFLGARPDGMEVRHLDGDATNPMVWNLAWATHKENESDKTEHESRRLTRLSDAEVKEMRGLRTEGWTVDGLAARYLISRSHVYSIVTNRVRKARPTPVS